MTRFDLFLSGVSATFLAWGAWTGSRLSVVALAVLLVASAARSFVDQRLIVAQREAIEIRDLELKRERR